MAAAEFVINTDWSRDDFVAWAYALRGAFGDAGRLIWIRFAAQSVKATNPATAEKVWRDATQAERDGHLCAGAGTVIFVAKEEGWTPTPLPGLPAYFDGGEQDPAQASADLRLAIMTWVEQGLAYIGKGEAPRDAIAGGVGLGKSTVTLEVLAQMAQGVTVHYYAPTLELGDEIVTKAKALGLDAVMIRGREANKKNPELWPALCTKEDVAATLGRVGRNVWESLCRKQDNRAPCLGGTLDLRLDDVLPDGVLRIRKTKFGKSRLVPLHPTVAAALNRYLDLRRGSAVTDDHLFLSARHRRMPYSTVNCTFRRVLRLAGVARARSRPPRIHDLRHTFATRALERCSTRREAVTRHFVALATYLGHADIAHTYWYLEATPELMTDIAAAAEMLVVGEAA